MGWMNMQRHVSRRVIFTRNYNTNEILHDDKKKRRDCTSSDATEIDHEPRRHSDLVLDHGLGDWKKVGMSNPVGILLPEFVLVGSDC